MAGFGRIDQRSNKRYRARYINPEQRRTESGSRNYISAPTTFLRKSEARAWLDSVDAAISSGKWKSPEQEAIEKKEAQREATVSGQTFGDYAISWMQFRRLKPSTRRTYQIYLGKHILPRWSDTPLRNITTPEIRVWLTSVAPGRSGARKKSFELFKTILNSAVDDDIIAVNPCKRNMLGTTKAARKDVKPSRKGEPRALTESELRTLADEVPHYMRLPVLLSGLVGLRMGEVRALRGRHIKELNGALVLQIREGVTGDGSTVTFDTPKSKKSVRDIKVPASLVEGVRLAVEDAGPNGLLFHPVGDSTRPIPDQSYRNNIARASDRAAIGHVSPHDLRHTAASIMQNNGVPDHVVADLLGHENTTITRRYTHSNRAAQFGAIDIIDRAVSGTTAGTPNQEEQNKVGR